MKTDPDNLNGARRLQTSRSIVSKLAGSSLHRKPKIAFATLLLCIGQVYAQYSITGHRITGGGGASTNGQYAVSGTIGQHDSALPMTHGQYSVAGGFWSALSLLQTPGAPTLAAELLSNGNVRIYWPGPATGFVLDRASVFPSSPAQVEWNAVASPYDTNATHISIIVLPFDRAYYRLRKP